MNELVGRKQYNGTTEFNMPMSVEFKAEDIFRLKAAFETLTKYELVYSDESRSYTVKERNDSLAEYSE